MCPIKLIKKINKLVSLTSIYFKHPFFHLLVFNGENAKAKRCVKNLLACNCTFLEIIQKMFDTSLSDYNPYCANNRDPGATGNYQCHGDKRNPTSATASRKSSVLQALFFPLLIWLFFVRQSTNQIFSV